MTKAEMIKKLKDDCGLHGLEQAKKCLESVCQMCLDAMLAGEKITLPGVGIFGVRKTKPRMVRNPRTGETFEKPAGVRACFTPSKALKDALN